MYVLGSFVIPSIERLRSLFSVTVCIFFLGRRRRLPSCSPRLPPINGNPRTGFATRLLLTSSDIPPGGREVPNLSYDLSSEYRIPAWLVTGHRDCVLGSPES